MATKKMFPIFEKNYRPKRVDHPLHEIQMTFDRSQQEQKQRSKRMRCLLGKRETPGLTQMIIDAGQKVIGPVHCEDCGLLYSPGDIEDEKEHRKAHSRLDNLFSIRLWKNATVVQDYPAEACMIVVVDCQTQPKRVLNCLKDFLEWLDSELGGVNDTGRKPSEKIYLYLFRTKRKNMYRVLGCVIVESIEQDKVACRSLNPEVNDTPTPPNPILFGLTRLWTDTDFRRRHIAFKLCDAIRASTIIPGFIIPRHQIGILEPSEDGKAFMSRYTGGKGWLYTYKNL